MNKNENTQQLKQREILSEHQFYLPTAKDVIGFAERTKETLKPPGRFKSPNLESDYLAGKIRQKIADIVELEDTYSFRNSGYPVPQRWQEILNYLYEGGYLASPYVQFESLFNDEPKIHSVRLISAPIDQLTDGNYLSTNRYSRGVSNDFEEALSKVIGEFLERYPLTIYRKQHLFRGSFRSLHAAKKNPLNIFEVASFADWQKELSPKKRFDENSGFAWVKGTELLTNQPSMIPAQLVFWNYRLDEESNEPFLRQPITNGAAGHFTREEAILAGIYENIQRDAFLVHWLNNIVPPRIDSSTISDRNLRKLIEEIERYNLEPILLNTTLDLKVPSCVCVLLDDTGRGPRVSVGGGCGPDMVCALIRSITEALGVRHWIRTRTAAYALPSGYLPFRDARIGQESRLALWGNAEMFDKFLPFLQGRVQTVQEAQSSFPVLFSAPQLELGYMLDIFRSMGHGYEVYVYDAMHPMLKALRYHSVRVIIPALVPLYLRESEAPLGLIRLRTAPARIGYDLIPETFNPWPHPFP